MPQGLQVWDELGKLTFDGTRRTGRLLLEVQMNTMSGAAALPPLPAGHGQLFWYWDISLDAFFQQGHTIPTVTLTGAHQVSWTMSSNVYLGAWLFVGECSL